MNCDGFPTETCGNYQYYSVYSYQSKILFKINLINQIYQNQTKIVDLEYLDDGIYFVEIGYIKEKIIVRKKL